MVVWAVPCERVSDVNSLLTAKNTENSSVCRSKWPNCATLQRFIPKFPNSSNRENYLQNRELWSGNKEFPKRKFFGRTSLPTRKTDRDSRTEWKTDVSKDPALPRSCDEFNSTRRERVSLFEPCVACYAKTKTNAGSSVVKWDRVSLIREVDAINRIRPALSGIPNYPDIREHARTKSPKLFIYEPRVTLV